MPSNTLATSCVEPPRSTFHPESILFVSKSRYHRPANWERRSPGDGRIVRPVSQRDWLAPCLTMFAESKLKLCIERAAPFGWGAYVGFDGAIIGVADFGASASGRS